MVRQHLARLQVSQAWWLAGAPELARASKRDVGGERQLA
jgi:hypothetical protein